ncbi:hypothetical protein [Serratia oryzae]|jgi:hypothetical protein|uniref:hypothetical protein n=1 Tax=Serratia oryzae TaxID=2034155 RepID=UPI0012E1B947|nr:hypothetical protein [Serratia oryzae]VXC90586.1 conserved hypothetical protein [Enterobacterales bacterium 8AC]
MRPGISKEEVTLFLDDLTMLLEEGIDKAEVYNVLRILEFRRQTAKLEFIKRLLTTSSDNCDIDS